MRHHNNVLSEILETNETNVDVVDENLALFRFKCTEQCQCEGAFASTSPADNTNLLTGQDLEGDVLEYRVEVAAVSSSISDELNRALTRPVSRRSVAFNNEIRFLVHVQVLLDALDRVHVLLVAGVETHKPEDVLGESHGISHSQTCRTCIDLADTGHDKGTGKEGNQSTNNVNTEGQPSVSSPQVDEWAAVSVDLVKIVTDEAALITVGTDRGSTGHGLAKLLVEGTALNRLETLQVSRRGDVEATDKEVQDRDEESSDKETRCDRRDQNDNRDDGEEAVDEADGNRSDFLVNGFDVLGEAVHDLAERGGVKEAELCACDTLHQLAVNTLGCADGTTEEHTLTEQSDKHVRHTEYGVDSEVVPGINFGAGSGNLHVASALGGEARNIPDA